MSNLKIIVWDSNENQVDMNIEQKWELELKDHLVSRIYSWWQSNQFYIDLLDNKTLGWFTNKLIYAEFKEFVFVYHPNETLQKLKRVNYFKKDNIDKIWAKVDSDLRQTFFIYQI